MIHRVLALSIVLGLFAATTQAQDDSAMADYRRNGLYVGLAGTYAIEDLQHSGAQSVDNSLGFNLRFGHRFHPYLSFGRLGKGTFQTDLIPARGYDGSLHDIL